MSNVLTEIIGLLTEGITGIAEGIGGGLQNLVTEIFLTTGADGAQSLSVFGGVVVIFAGVALAIGLSRLVVGWVTSLGGSGM